MIDYTTIAYHSDCANNDSYVNDANYDANYGKVVNGDK